MSYISYTNIINRSLFAACILAVLVVFSSVAQAEEQNSNTTSEVDATAVMQTKIQELMAQVKMLQQQLAELQKQRPVDKKDKVDGQKVIEVEVLQNLRVRAEAGLNGVQLSIKQKGMRGEMVEGPVMRGGMEWYKIKYSDGTIGWSAGNWLKKTERVRAFLEDKKTDKSVKMESYKNDASPKKDNSTSSESEDDNEDEEDDAS